MSDAWASAATPDPVTLAARDRWDASDAQTDRLAWAAAKARALEVATDPDELDAILADNRTVIAAVVERTEAAVDPLVEAGRLPEVQRVGLGYVARFARLGIVIHLDRIRESRGDTTAELTIRRYGSHLLQQRFNLTSGTARGAMARDLDGRPRPNGWERVDWRELLEMTCLAVLARERAGDALDTIGQDPIVRTVERRLFVPFVPLAAPTLIWAPGGTGKSTFARAMVASLELTAEVLPGWHPRNEARCLVLDYESDRTEWNNGLRRIAAGIGMEFEREIHYIRMTRPVADQVERLSMLVAERGIGFVVVDSVEKAMGAGDSGDTYERRALRLFDAIRLLGPVTSILIDHVTGDDLRTGEQRVIRKSIGSTMKQALARGAYDLKRERDPAPGLTEYVLHNAKPLADGPQVPPYSFRIRYDGDDGPIRFELADVIAEELVATLPIRMRSAQTLYREGPMTAVALARLLDEKDKSVRNALARNPRVFVQHVDGRWGITTEWRDYA
jgi:hypothetical protein